MALVRMLVYVDSMNLQQEQTRTELVTSSVCGEQKKLQQEQMQ